MTSRRLAWIVGIAVAAVLAVVLTINGIRSAQVNQRLRDCELANPVGTAAYEVCAERARQ
ncbi:MAG: hypothetical protein HY996_10035 [Micrococcales bacterium]|nr:hypothetical protein [Micrococcales bacterium]